MALPRRTVLVALGVALGGCAGSDPPSDTATETERESDSPTKTDTPTGTEPAYLHCDGPTVSTTIPTDAAVIPDSLTEESVVEYVERLEEFFALPLEDGEPDGYVSIATVSVETVDYGYIATVPVTGGYYNEADDDTTETVHHDLAPYTATYFVSEQVVRRAEDANTELDPRDHGEVVVCPSA